MPGTKQRRFVLFILLFVSTVFLANLQSLARYPQNPDGAELVMAALQGGVLHPPGFPVQAWLDKLIINLPLETPAKAISILSLAAYCLAIWILLLITHRLEYSFIASLFAAISFALYPSVWEMAVQPEKYALCLMFQSLVILQSLILIQKKDGTPKPSSLVIYGITFGTAIGQHIALSIVLPFVIAVITVTSSSSNWRTKRSPLVIIVSSATISTALWYLSLLLLTKPSAWPDWGKLTSVDDVARHFLRRDLPHFMGGLQQTSDGTVSGLQFFIDLLWRHYHVLIFIAPFGFYYLWKSRQKPIRIFTICLFFSMLLTMFALSKAKLDTDLLVAQSYLERYSVFAVFSIALFLGGALNYWVNGSVKIKAVALLFVIGFAIANIVYHYERIDCSQDEVLKIYREALGATLPTEALYVYGNDLEVFYGASSAQAVRFPLVGGYAWYNLKVIPLLEKRFAIAPGITTVPSLDELIEVAYKSGLPIYTTTPNALTRFRHMVEGRGLFFVIQSGIENATSFESIRAATKLCDYVSMVNRSIPREGHYWSRALWADFSDGFEPAKLYYSQFMNADGTRLVSNVQTAMRKGSAPQDWIAACNEFVHYARSDF